MLQLIFLYDIFDKISKLQKDIAFFLKEESSLQNINAIEIYNKAQNIICSVEEEEAMFLHDNAKRMRREEEE